MRQQEARWASAYLGAFAIRVASLGHTVRVSQRYQQSGGFVYLTERGTTRAFVDAKESPELARQLSRTAQGVRVHLAGQCAAFVGAFQPLQPGAQVRIAWAAARQYIAFCQQGGQVRGEPAVPDAGKELTTAVVDPVDVAPVKAFVEAHCAA